MSLRRKLKKAYWCFVTREWRYALSIGVGAAIEHDFFFRGSAFDTIVDIGANKGQFSLVMVKNCPKAQVYAFEPLSEPFETLATVFASNDNVTLFNSAVGPSAGSAEINVSKSSDSSSILQIGSLQEAIFPGTGLRRKEQIFISPLTDSIDREQIRGRSLLKLDVQGYELQALVGCSEFLDLFDMVYCECSFVELYVGQALAYEVIEFLRLHDFKLEAMNNVQYDERGVTIQADFIFGRKVLTNATSK